MSVLNTGLATPSRGYDIDQSLRFNDDDTAYLSWTPAGAGNQRTWTWSGWVKRGHLGSSTYQCFYGVDGVSPNDRTEFTFSEADALFIYEEASSTAISLTTSALFRDPSAWYHIVIAMDTTQGTDTNKVKIYVNGEQITSFSGSTYPSLNYDSFVNSTNKHIVGARGYADGTVNKYFDGYLSEVNFIDGTALTPSSFGEAGDYGEWKPIKYTGSYGTNGFYLDFSDSAALGDDAANSNDFAVTNLTAADQMLDSPTNNFCTFSPIDHALGDAGTLSEGNLKWVNGSDDTVRGTLAVTSGKWYFEAIPKTTVDGSNPIMFGIMGTTGLPAHSGMDRANYIYSDNDSNHGIYHVEAGSASTATVTAFTSLSVDDVLGMAFDMDTGKIWLSMGGTWLDSGDPAAGSNPAYTMATTGDIPMTIGADHAGVTYTVIYNCGQDSSFAGNKTAQGNGDAGDDFYYTPPSGFKSLKTSNLPAVAVTPSEHFNTVLYTGNGSDGHAITGVGFQPDFNWTKNRSTVRNHTLTDAVRGATECLFSSLNDAETTLSTSLQSFDSDGFTVGTYNNFNTNTDTYVAWNWKANGAGSANTDGDMAETVTVSANTDAGFSIVTYTGDGSAATVGHGLSKALEMIIVKNRDATDDWRVYHSGNTAAPETDYLELNDDAATADDAENWNDTAPTSSVFTIGDGDNVNTDDETYVAYCFHSVEGYSKVGSYTGNGNADGTFVYTGFKPAYVLLKITDDTNNWFIFDNKRDTYNVAEHRLYASTSDAEATGLNTMDMLSNGFKFRDTNLAWNASGNNYIYIAFAETPFRYANAR